MNDNAVHPDMRARIGRTASRLALTLFAPAALAAQDPATATRAKSRLSVGVTAGTGWGAGGAYEERAHLTADLLVLRRSTQELSARRGLTRLAGGFVGANVTIDLTDDCLVLDYDPAVSGSGRCAPDAPSFGYAGAAVALEHGSRWTSVLASLGAGGATVHGVGLRPIAQARIDLRMLRYLLVASRVMVVPNLSGDTYRKADIQLGLRFDDR